MRTHKPSLYEETTNCVPADSDASLEKGCTARISPLHFYQNGETDGTNKGRQTGCSRFDPTARSNHTSIIYSSLSFEGHRRVGPNASWHLARGRVHPGQVVSASQGRTCRDKQPPTPPVCVSLDPGWTWTPLSATVLSIHEIMSPNIRRQKPYVMKIAAVSPLKAFWDKLDRRWTWQGMFDFHCESQRVKLDSLFLKSPLAR